MKRKKVIIGVALVVLSLSCNKKNTEIDGSCPPLHYSDKFEAVFIEETSCGSLKDVDFVYDYSNDKCTIKKRMVDMSKYNSSDTGKRCNGDKNAKIYSYEKKDLK